MNRYILFCNSVWLSLFYAPITWSQTPQEPLAIPCQAVSQLFEQTESNDPQIYLHLLAADNLSSVLLCPPVPLKVAQAEIPTSTTATLPEEESELEITVTGTKLQPRLRNPLPQTVVNRKEFSDRSGLRGGDVLRRLPGVIIQGGPGADKDVWLRGIDKEYTRTQIDGITVPNGGEKREFQFNQLPAFAIEEIKVIRNSTAEYESDGIAGRIDVRTRSIPTKFTSEARVGYGGQKFGK
jgi:outer membrane cobalamin receptor